MADEEMLEEVSIITITGEDGTEEYYLEDGEIEFDGKRFAFLTQVTETGEEMEDGEAIIARVETEDGELVFLAPTDEEFDGVLKEYEQLLAEEVEEE
ncbi:DUF1292 domain-containing protein [Colibacter massiliensis]|uniref:DUF1292 domain-containing protein n=1 Tax=Colibacter massiliensis TaxID=1852379 RepID=UPI00094F0C1C|nr:DUF1292 domain-containing protein [Colibacter massiliensis]